MKSMTALGNFIGEVIMAAMYCGILWTLGWLSGQKIPMWGYFLAMLIGGIAWSRPRYDRIKDFYD